MLFTIKLTVLYLPLVFAGVLNMYFVKAPFLTALKYPLDFGKTLPDGEHLFGTNKTWKGLVGMTTLTALFFLLHWFLANKSQAVNNLALFPFRSFQNPFTVLAYGWLWGLGYILFELPNSFIKRRLKIRPGKKTRGILGIFFIFLDQFDSVLGCSIVMLLFYHPSPGGFISIILAGIVIHYLVNVYLFLTKVKSRPG